jgi:hypothetical protein
VGEGVRRVLVRLVVGRVMGERKRMVWAARVRVRARAREKRARRVRER